MVGSRVGGDLKGKLAEWEAEMSDGVAMQARFVPQRQLVKRTPSLPRTTALAWGAAVVLVVILVYAQTLRFPFFPFWDDDIHVHSNPHIANLSWSSIGALWSGPWQQLYIPLTYTVWAALALISRTVSGEPLAGGALNAAWFHGANVLLHSLAAAMVFLLLRRVLEKFAPSSTPGRVAAAAALGAAFFALHPLQVEPVAWVSGLRDVLGGCLGIAALAVLFARDEPGVARCLAAGLLFLASLAAKPAGVALPLIAAILAIQPFRWPVRRMFLVLGPWLLAAAGWVVLTSNAQSAADLARGLVPAWMRPFVAGDALAFYLGKAFWPAWLSADYGRSPDRILATGAIWWTWLGPAALVAALTIFRPLRPYLVPAAVFGAALLPTLGLVPFNFQVVSTVADRYAYVALLGPAMALGLVLVRGVSWRPVAAASAVVAALAALTLLRLPLWSEDLRLFAATVEVNPRSWKALHNYASALDDRGRTAEALPLMREVVARRPDGSEGHNDLAVMLWKLGQHSEAVESMRHSLAVRPTPSSARNLVQMQSQLGSMDGLIEALRILVELEPENVEAERTLTQLRAQREAAR